ncbi:MAG: hypothetical protein FJ294_02320 [Planctomycetes bacterium]|nr:hypothetical protein [Planctomycetota bacterium]
MTRPIPAPRLRRLSALALGLAALAASCISTTARHLAAVGQFESGCFDDARAGFEDERAIGSPFLRGAEVGMVELARGNWDEAQRALDGAVDAVRELEERALIGPANLGEAVGSLVINEGVKDYQGEGYERVQVHNALALTYLARGSLDGVYVETRRANKLLETEEGLYQKKYAAGGFGHLLSAVSYELQGRYDEAYIDYRRMAEKELGLELAGRALVRIATRLRYDDELPRLVERFGEPSKLPQDAASIVVLGGLGLGPYKVENTLALMTPSGLAQFSVPRFVPRPQLVSTLELVVDDGAPLRTSQVESVNDVAARNLEDRMGWLAARSALRGAMKLIATNAVAESVRRKHGDAAGVAAWLVGSLLTAATERADTRCWFTLPAEWHAARMWVAPGEHSLRLRAVGGDSVSLGTLRLAPGETLVILARSLGPRLHVHSVGGETVAAAPAPLQP